MPITAVSMFLLHAALAGGAPPCEGVAFYDSLNAWTEATSGAALVVDFDEPSWPVNQPLSGTWTVNGVSFVGLAGSPFPNIYVASFGSPFGTGHWLVANGDENIDIVLPGPQHAVALDAASNGFGPATIRVYGTSSELLATLAVPASTSRFVGVTSGQAIGHLNFASTAGAVVDTGIDNLRLAAYAVAIAGDLDGDGHVGPKDLALLLGDWGGNGIADVDCDGIVGPADLAILLGNWTT